MARCLKLCVSGPGCAGGPSVQLLPLPGHFPGRVARDELGLDGSAEKGLPGCVYVSGGRGGGGREFPAFYL